MGVGRVGDDDDEAKEKLAMREGEEEKEKEKKPKLHSTDLLAADDEACMALAEPWAAGEFHPPHPSPPLSLSFNAYTVLISLSLCPL